jgi:hypothetical protein
MDVKWRRKSGIVVHDASVSRMSVTPRRGEGEWVDTGEGSKRGNDEETERRRDGVVGEDASSVCFPRVQ